MSAINIPGYKIVKTLGVGGQATVYLAIQEGFDREVALKVMSPALAADPTFGERFIREAKIVAKLRHPGIVTVYDVGEHDGFYFLAMEFLPDMDLRTRINQGMKAKDALQVIEKVSRALHFAHEKGYIHRDVKSENILFRDDGEPVLTDFGIAKASNSSTQMTQQGKLIGTPQYMSPEQCRGRPLDGRSDIYSLGIILHEMLTQSVPFDGEDSVAVCLQHVTKPIPRLPVRQKHYQWLLDRMLAKKPDDRFATGVELAEEINKFLAGDLSATKRSSKTELRAERDIAQVYAEDEQEMIAEGRITQKEEHKSARWPWVVGILIAVSAVGYLQQERWLPQAKQLYANLMQSTQPAGEVSETNVNKPSATPSQSSSSESRTTQSQSLPLSNSGLTPEQEARQKQIAQLLVEADSLEPLPNLEPAEIKTLLQNYLRVLVLEPDHTLAKERKEAALVRAADLARGALSKHNEDAYIQYFAVVEGVAPEHPVLAELTQSYQSYQQKQQLEAQNAEIQQQLEALLANADTALSENRLTSPAEDNAHFYYTRVLELDTGNEAAQNGLNEITDKYIKMAQQSLLNKSVDKARTSINKVRTIAPDDERITELEQQYQVIKKQVEEEQKVAAAEAERRKKQQEREQMLADPLVQLKIQSKLNGARDAYGENRLVLPESDNALAKYREVLDIDPSNQQALDGIELVKSKLVSLIKDSIQQGSKTTADEWLVQLSAHFSEHPDIPLFRQQIAEMDVQLVPESPDPTNSGSANSAFDASAQPVDLTGGTQAGFNSSPNTDKETGQDQSVTESKATDDKTTSESETEAKPKDSNSDKKSEDKKKSDDDDTNP